MVGGEITEYIELTCIPNPNGGKPYFDPPYNHITNPFPPCIVEVFGKFKAQARLLNVIVVTHSFYELNYFDTFCDDLHSFSRIKVNR